MRKKIMFFFFIFSLFSVMGINDVYAETALGTDNGLGVSLNFGGEQGMTDSIKTFLLVTMISLAPMFFVMLTPYPYIVIVLGLTKQSLGTNSVPPAMVMSGLALFLSLFMMGPIIKDINQNAYQPMQEGKITLEEGIERAEKPLKEYMYKNTQNSTVLTFLKMKDEEKPKNLEDLDFTTLAVSYTVSMMNQGLLLGMMIYFSFLIIDLIIGSILMAMGMMMLPPQIVSLPFKLLIFVSIGGFEMITKLIVTSVN